MARAARTTLRLPAEHRWPEAIAVLSALALYAALPGGFAPGLRWVVAGICVAMLVLLVIFNPTHLNRESVWSRRVSGLLAYVLLIANQVALVEIVIELLTATRSDGGGVLLGAVQVWATNVVAYSLLYWELDRGGPVARRREARKDLPAADFRFPQDEIHENVDEVARRSSKTTDWMPSYFDYLYFSFSNTMAFSATDVMPLTHRAKALMLLQSLAGFVILALVIARSVNLLG